MPPDSLLHSIRTLECELHDPAVRRDAHRLDELLHADFQEIGRSGRCYTKAEMLRLLPQEQDPARIQTLAPDVVLLTYKSAQVGAAGLLERQTLRASVWNRGPAGWQMIFHQGTPASDQ
ncbi:MAG: DUF4440 domain-containing protein [Planctomycetota bacterium]|nr:DUF4440 domain-containing protein [Planctomycetota bacterium]